MSADQQTRVVIRPAERSDAAAVARVHVESWRSSYAGILPDRFLLSMSETRNAAQWRRIIDNPRCDETLTLATCRTAQGEQVLAFGSAGKSRHPKLSPAGEVYTLYVASDWQGQGIGRQLLVALFERLLERGHDSALIAVLSANPARFFYEAQGGRKLGSFRENFAGRRIEQTFYAWDDLPDWLAARSSTSRKQL